MQIFNWNTKAKSWDAGALIYPEDIVKGKSYYFGSDLSLSHDGKNLVIGSPGYGSPVEFGAFFVHWERGLGPLAPSSA